MPKFAPALPLILELVSACKVVEEPPVQDPSIEQARISSTIQKKVFECRHLYRDTMYNASGYVGGENLTVTEPGSNRKIVTCMDANADGYVDGIKVSTNAKAEAWFYDPSSKTYLEEGTTHSSGTPKFDAMEQALPPNANHAARMAGMTDAVVDWETVCKKMKDADPTASHIFLSNMRGTVGSVEDLTLLEAYANSGTVWVRALDEITGLEDEVALTRRCD